MLTARVIKSILATLPAPMLERLRFVTIEHRSQPGPEDVARGAGPDHRGYFYGHCVERSDAPEAELPDEDPPQGTIVLFTARIRPLSVKGIAVVLLHEIAHALGYDHDVIVDELGLA